jgi:NitT/TauT family transport system ATP-binding protein
VTLHVEREAFVSLLGPSGCGKTTLLRIFAGLTDWTAGTVMINGISPREFKEQRGYGMVFQSPTLFDWRSVSRNVEMPLEVRGVSRRDRRRIASEVLDLVGLESFKNSRVWELSGGMQQRVSIARALSFRPSLLLMDEPFGALDEMTRERLNLELLRIKDETKTTVVFVTHSISEAVFLSDRVIVMSDRPGRVAADIPVDLGGDRHASSREEPRYFEYVNAVRSALYSSKELEIEPPVHGEVSTTY